MSYWAVGIARGWVELREGAKPKPIQSSFTTKVKVPNHNAIPVLDAHTGRYAYPEKDGKWTMKVIVHEGGKVINTFRSDAFRRATMLSVAEGKCVRVSKELGDTLKKRNSH
jgi:hypothetical protein